MENIVIPYGAVSQIQYESLEIFLSSSLNLNIYSKKVLLWFLRQSNYLVSNIAVTIPYEKEESKEQNISIQIAHEIHDMSNILYNIFNLMALPKKISVHFGKASVRGNNLIKFETGWDSRNQKEILLASYGYTMWFSSKPYSLDVKLLEFNWDEVNKTRLRKNYYCLSSSDSKSSTCDCEYYQDDEVPAKTLDRSTF